MKKISFLIIGYFIVCQLFAPKLQAQVGTPALLALNNNGYLLLQGRSSTDVADVFVQDSTSGSIALSFDFGPDDVRNGIRTSSPVLQATGKVDFYFSDVPLTLGQDISFDIRQYDPETDTYRDILIRGGELFMPPPGIKECPISMRCMGNKGLILTFASKEAAAKLKIGSEGGISFFFGPGDPLNRMLEPSSFGFFTSTELFVGFWDCTALNIMNRTITIIFNDLICTFKNGQKVDSNCSLFSDYYTPGSACSELFESCGNSLLWLLREESAKLPCRQWQENDKHTCATWSHIHRTGKVAIGTTQFSNLGILTVKNGIITDQVTIKDCQTGNFTWCDYVFEPGYPLLSLEQVAKHIEEKRHLPGMPSAAEIEKEGSFELGDITFRQQEKIEELYLYLIALEKELADLEAEWAVLQRLEKPQRK